MACQAEFQPVVRSMEKKVNMSQGQINMRKARKKSKNVVLCESGHAHNALVV